MNESAKKRIITYYRINKIALNVDLAPTFLDIAGIKPPPHMDGRSLLPLLKSDQPDYVTWRDSFLVERYGDIAISIYFTK